MGKEGKELDAYILGLSNSLEEYSGMCVAVIQRTNDTDDKLMVAPEGISITDPEIEAGTRFQEQYFEHVLLRKSAP